MAFDYIVSVNDDTPKEVDYSKASSIISHVLYESILAQMFTIPAAIREVMNSMNKEGWIKMGMFDFPTTEMRFIRKFFTQSLHCFHCPNKTKVNLPILEEFIQNDKDDTYHFRFAHPKFMRYQLDEFTQFCSNWGEVMDDIEFKHHFSGAMFVALARDKFPESWTFNDLENVKLVLQIPESSAYGKSFAIISLRLLTAETQEHSVGMIRRDFERIGIRFKEKTYRRIRLDFDYGNFFL